MKQYILKDALLVLSAALGIGSSLGKFDVPWWAFVGIVIVYAFLRYTDKTVVIKRKKK